MKFEYSLRLCGVRQVSRLRLEAGPDGTFTAQRAVGFFILGGQESVAESAFCLLGFEGVLFFVWVLFAAHHSRSNLRKASPLDESGRCL